MKLSQASILLLPGCGDSSPDHWQSRWEKKLSTAHRVHQDNWSHPARAHWVARILQAVGAARNPVVLVTHGLGGIAAAWAAHETGADKIAGAFIVAPPSEARLREIVEIDRAFASIPRAKLPFPALLVASRNDPSADYAWSEAIASSWGATCVDAGEAGRIDSESGFGPWPEGLLRFGHFIQKL